MCNFLNTGFERLHLTFKHSFLTTLNTNISEGVITKNKGVHSNPYYAYYD